MRHRPARTNGQFGLEGAVEVLLSGLVKEALRMRPSCIMG